MMLVQSSISDMGYSPLPLPQVLVGVFTEMKMRSASFMAVSMSVEKNRFTLRHFLTTSSRPGWKQKEAH